MYILHQLQLGEKPLGITAACSGAPRSCRPGFSSGTLPGHQASGLILYHIFLTVLELAGSTAYVHFIIMIQVKKGTANCQVHSKLLFQLLTLLQPSVSHSQAPNSNIIHCPHSGKCFHVMGKVHKDRRLEEGTDHSPHAEGPHLHQPPTHTAHVSIH